jgi:hypothetical protein
MEEAVIHGSNDGGDCCPKFSGFCPVVVSFESRAFRLGLKVRLGLAKCLSEEEIRIVLSR